jgi:hypothetical protein
MPISFQPANVGLPIGFQCQRLPRPPEDKVGQEAFAVIRDAMKKKMVALRAS